MKYFNFLLMLFIIALLGACDQEEVIIGDSMKESQTSKSGNVQAVYKTNLPSNVDSITIVNYQHPMAVEAMNSNSYNSFKITNTYRDVAIYHYSFGIDAVVIGNRNSEKVFIYLVDDTDGAYVDSFRVTYDFIESNNEGVKELQVDLVADINDLNYYYNSSNNLKEDGGSWGDCMDEAMDDLYDDWGDDPVGTFACWATGPLCAIGGALACGLQAAGIAPAS